MVFLLPDDGDLVNMNGDNRRELLRLAAEAVEEDLRVRPIGHMLPKIWAVRGFLDSASDRDTFSRRPHTARESTQSKMFIPAPPLTARPSTSEVRSSRLQQTQVDGTRPATSHAALGSRGESVILPFGREQQPGLLGSPRPPAEQKKSSTRDLKASMLRGMSFSQRQPGGPGGGRNESLVESLRVATESTRAPPSLRTHAPKWWAPDEKMESAIDVFDVAYRQKQLRANRVLESLRRDPTSMRKDNALDEAIWELSKQRLAVHEAIGGIRTYEKRVKKVHTASRAPLRANAAQNHASCHASLHTSLPRTPPPLLAGQGQEVEADGVDLAAASHLLRRQRLLRHA